MPLTIITSRVIGRGNVFVVSVCVSAITFQTVDIETSFLVWWYILTISRSRVSRSLGQGQGHLMENANLANCTSVLTWFDLPEVKVTMRLRLYQGHWVKFKVISWKILIWPPGHQFNLV